MSVVAATSPAGELVSPGGVRAPRRQFLVVLLAFLGLHLAWALATPVMSGPDEPAHIARAVSLWQGDLLPRGTAPGGWAVQVPSPVAAYGQASDCYKWHPEVAAGCALPADDAGATPGRSVTVGTAAGRYFPLYYAAVGWPARLDSSVAGFYAMRLIGLVVSAVLLALAVVTVLRTAGRRWAALVLPVAITPQVVWLGTVVNPNAWEVDGAILAWAAGLALVCGCPGERAQVLWDRFLLGAGVMVLTRRLSPMWLVLIVAGVLVFRLCLPAEQRPALRALASRRARWVLAVLAALAVVSMWWHLSYDVATLDVAMITGPTPGGIGEALRIAAPNTLWWLAQTYGVFGSLDTPAPTPALFAWLGVGGVTLALVLLGTRHRLRTAAAVGLGVALWLVIPLAFSATVGRTVGVYFWQGRYTMPLSQGIPLALGMLGAARRDHAPELDQLTGWISRVAVWIMWPVLATLSLAWTLHRYTTGVAAAWRVSDLPWSPPTGVVALTALHAVAAVVLTGAVVSRPAVTSTASRTGPADDIGHPPKHVGHRGRARRRGAGRPRLRPRRELS